MASQSGWIVHYTLYWLHLKIMIYHVSLTLICKPFTKALTHFEFILTPMESCALWVYLHTVNHKVPSVITKVRKL